MWCALFLLITGFVLSFAGCSDSQLDITGPTGVGGPGEIVPAGELLDEPAFDAGPMFELRQVHGFSAFALPTHSANDQSRALNFVERRVYNTPRICAETRFWSGVYPFPRSRWGQDGKLALDDLKVTLDMLASRGMYAWIVADCTLKHSQVSDAEREEWVRAVGRLTKPYANVAFEAVNEYWHPKSRVDRAEVSRLIRVLRGSSGGKLVGADNGLGFASGTYGYDRGLGSDFVSFHPWRNPDPTAGDIQRMVYQNGGLVVLSETTAWGTEADVAQFGNLVTTDKFQLQTYSDSCQPMDDCIFFGHSVEGLDAGEYTWLPRRDF